MRLAQLLLNPLGKINRALFLIAALLLTAIKLTVGYTVTTICFRQAWKPIEYVWSKSPLIHRRVLHHIKDQVERNLPARFDQSNRLAQDYVSPR